MLSAREKLSAQRHELWWGWGEELEEGAVLRMLVPFVVTWVSCLRVFIRPSLSATWGHSYRLIFKSSLPATERVHGEWYAHCWMRLQTYFVTSRDAAIGQKAQVQRFCLPNGLHDA